MCKDFTGNKYFCVYKWLKLEKISPVEYSDLDHMNICNWLLYGHSFYKGETYIIKPQKQFSIIVH